MDKISVIIPVYRSPEYLDLCLKSCIDGQTNQNEIIVVCDGYFDENKEVINKWKDHISVIEFETNQGLPRATNIGVYNASNEWVLIVNEDNVFCPNYMDKINQIQLNDNNIYSFNQVEPNPSIFPQFNIVNYGKNINEFNLEKWNKEYNMYSKLLEENTGGTLPFFMNANKFKAINGWDEFYPTNGVVCDLDFFHRCNIMGMNLIRSYICPFYHFSQISTGTQRQESEQYGYQYSYYKWGYYVKHNPNIFK